MSQSMLRYKFITPALLCSLFLSLVFLSCKKEPAAVILVNRTCLTDNVTSAQALYYGTEEGTKPGQFVAGSKATLKTALDAAINVLADSASTKEDVTNACAQLQAAITAYEANKIAEVAAANLIGFWKFDGSPADSSGHGNNGVLTQGANLAVGPITYYGGGMPFLTVDRFGRANMAYHFDHGGNIEVPYTSSLNPSTEMSISLWCKKDTAGRTINPNTYTMVALNRWNGYKYQWQETNRPFYTVRVIPPDSPANYINRDDNLSLDNEVWYQVAVTFKSGQMIFYVDGIKVATWTDFTGTAIPVPPSINFVIGQDLPTSQYQTVDGDFQVTWGGFWTGDLDEVMFYNVALTEQQVGAIYDNQKSP